MALMALMAAMPAALLGLMLRAMRLCAMVPSLWAPPDLPAATRCTV
jgi:hypothetical protein